ncbi:MAG: hypothetical protein ACFCBU_07355 [Cyanophyceae cyanobacterium]
MSRTPVEIVPAAVLIGGAIAGSEAAGSNQSPDPTAVDRANGDLEAEILTWGAIAVVVA